MIYNVCCVCVVPDFNSNTTLAVSLILLVVGVSCVCAGAAVCEVFGLVELEEQGNRSHLQVHHTRACVYLHVLCLRPRMCRTCR